ncbi:TRAP transporter small permease [Pseudomonas syringae]|uniref:TRAP transporter small permease protein n=1 Tax=Pseudomonas syringae pv. papulans TaxID=83963 RepID=A0A0P9Y7X9_PSESX|nr:TRAP transporter small permease subunit [Pseudomonas syringae]KPY29452.1 TrapT dctQ-M fusion permease, dicarboxylate transport [Pseudomonas syringae pv. papulans]KWS42686.1 C4-dicarboxylate ABC transporter permease [Pseudomonas syringae pv. papulans]MDH4601348.1 TRAP transporter small permease subunit [Pseudomonas syringae pv. papulans]MDH4622937.1 TRAP transporter small permease subunit [Pseudomonas syringae pv. papulans]RMN38995.1 TrapT dctQ-M fusion permease, dicarboxylate transport [Pse
MSISPHPDQPPSSLAERCLAVFGALMFAVTFLSILAGVFSRYLNLHGFEWSFEIATIGFIWVTFTGAVIAEMRQENVRFQGLAGMLPAALQKALDAFASLALLGISAWLLSSGVAFISRTGWMPTPVLRWPAGLSSLALISAAAMLAILAVVRLARLIRNGVRP